MSRKGSLFLRLLYLVDLQADGLVRDLGRAGDFAVIVHGERKGFIVDRINDKDLFEYVGRVISGLSSDQIVDLQESPLL